MSDTLPLISLIDNRCRELDLKKAGLVERLGYKNIPKGLRRLEQLKLGNLTFSQQIFSNLPAALDLCDTVVVNAIADTKEQLRQEDEDARRQAFFPHAVVLTERSIPSQIFFAGLIGASRHRRIGFDLTRAPDTFLSQAMAILKLKLNQFHGGIPFFGKATGLVINYTFERKAEFNLDGKLLKISPKAMQLGEATAILANGKPIIGIFGG